MFRKVQEIQPSRNKPILRREKCSTREIFRGTDRKNPLYVEKHIQEHGEEMMRVVHDIEEQKAEIRKLKETNKGNSIGATHDIDDNTQDDDSEMDDLNRHDTYPRGRRNRT